MTESGGRNINGLKIRAHLPLAFRIVAGLLLAATLLAIGIAFSRSRNQAEFRMIGFPTALSTDQVATIDRYERTETDNGVVKYYIKADRAVTFSDNHVELENAFIQVFDISSGSSDTMRSQKAVYVPEENKNFTAYFAGNVDIATRDSLNVKTEQLTYKRATETANADELLTFERGGVTGKAVGAIVDVKAKRLELLKDVEIETAGTDELKKAGTENAALRSGYAVYYQGLETIELRDRLKATMKAAGDNARTIEVEARSANVFLSVKDEKSRDVSKLELFDSVQIDVLQPTNGTTKIGAGYALYEKSEDRFELKNDVRIVTDEGGASAMITANAAVYEQSIGKIKLEGSGQIEQGTAQIRGDIINAQLYPNQKLKFSDVSGNAYLRQIQNGRMTEVYGDTVNAFFTDAQIIQNANVSGTAKAVLTPANPTEYSKVSLSARDAINVKFKNAGVIDQMQTVGRTEIVVNVPDTGPDAANKRILGDTVKAIFDGTGQNLRHAAATGNAEAYVEPNQASAQNYRTAVYAPNFECEFFTGASDPENCTASTNAKVVRTPTVAGSNAEQVINSQKLTAAFSAKTRDLERIDAVGDARFSQADRHASAQTIAYTASDSFVRLRGKEPTVWDSKARAKADEIEWNTKDQRSFLRGNARTTYYSQGSSANATPFGDTDKPVFLTAAQAEFDHKGETALYTGNARGWQENNFIRADRILIRQREGQLQADGSVQSLLYDAKRKENGREVNLPVFAAAARMTYDRSGRLLRYEDNVDIRQGSDRLTGGIANVYLTAANEVSRTEIEQNVVITQPHRRANADYAQYNTSDETVVLRGNPARVFDDENGSSQANQMTVFLRENRAVAEGPAKSGNGGRIRSVYKVKNTLQ